MSLLDQLKKLNPSFVGFAEQEINIKDRTIGYHVYGIDELGHSFSGGTSSCREEALRIAVAEAFERSFVAALFFDEFKRKQFSLDKFPSSSGFAAGFESLPTFKRSICEAVERWAWSKWIDEGYSLDLVSEPYRPTELASHLVSFFEEFKWFKKDLSINIDGVELDLKFVVFVGFKGEGVYPGSRVSFSEVDLWEHPVVEAFRNLNNCSSPETSSNEDIIARRAIFFSTNRKLAEEQMTTSKNSIWPKPELELCSNIPTEIPGIFLWRSLCSHYLGWDKGQLSRFVY